MKKTLFLITILFAFFCLGMMIWFAAKKETQWSLCWGVFSIWNYNTAMSYLNKKE